MIFMLGWAIGGLFFGVLGDRIGRAKTMLLTILVYSAFTGLSALSWDVWSFSFFRFLTGLGVGGEFAVGVSLVAEVIPDRARPFALGWVQAMSAVGNMTAAIIGMTLGKLEETGAVGSAWRWMFVIGMAPALLAVLIRRKLKEPEKWKAATRAEDGLASPESKAGSITELFGNPRWRKNAIVGMILGFSGVVGLWGIGFFSFDLIRPVFEADMKLKGGRARDHQGTPDLSRRPDLALAEPGRFLRRLRLHEGHGPHRPQARVRDLVLAGDDGDGRDLLFHRRIGRPLLDDPADGLRPDDAVRRLRDLLPRAVPDEAPEHRDLVLLQRRPPGRRRRPPVPRAHDEPGLRRLRRDHGPTLRRGDDVPRLPHRPGRPPLRPRDEGEAIAGVSW